MFSSGANKLRFNSKGDHHPIAKGKEEPKKANAKKGQKKDDLSDSSSSDSGEWSDTSSDSGGVESEDEAVGERVTKNRMRATAEPEIVPLAQMRTGASASVGDMLRSRKNKRNSLESLSLEASDSTALARGGIGGRGKSRIKSRIQSSEDSDDEYWDEELMFEPIVLSLSSDSTIRKINGSGIGVANAKKEIEEIKRRMELTRQLLDMRESSSSSIYSKMTSATPSISPAPSNDLNHARAAPVTVTSDDTALSKPRQPIEPESGDKISPLISPKSPNHLAPPTHGEAHNSKKRSTTAPERKRSPRGSPSGHEKEKGERRRGNGGTRIRRQLSAPDGTTSVKLRKTFASLKVLSFKITIPDRQYDPFATFSIPVNVRIRNESSAVVRYIKMLVAITEKPPKKETREETRLRERSATRVHVRETKVRLDEKGKFQQLIKYSFPLLEKKVLADLDKYSVQLWVECMIHRHNGVKAKIPLKLKKRSK